MEYTRLLKKGSRGDDVKAVQTALHCYPDGDNSNCQWHCNGIFGNKGASILQRNVQKVRQNERIR